MRIRIERRLVKPACVECGAKGKTHKIAFKNGAYKCTVNCGVR